MNSNLNRALAAALLALGGTASALAQFDSSAYCIDPNNSAPYTTDFINYQQRTALFGAEVGVQGSVAFGPAPVCDGGGPVRGRIGFTLGSRGSYQDDDPNQSGSFVNPLSAEGPLHDNYLTLTLGANFAVGGPYNLAYKGPIYNSPTGGQSYARVYVTRTPNGGQATTTSYLFGNTGFTYAYIGRSGRYMLTQGTVTTGIDVNLTMDVLGDAARLQWTISDSIDTTDTVAVGLYFGQNVRLLDSQGVYQYVEYGLNDNTFLTDYITIPGRRPLTEQERFNNTGLSPQGQTQGATIGVPPYVNFTMNQAAGFGLQVVNDPSALTGFDLATGSGADQTPVDEFVLGESPFLIDGTYNAADPQFGDFIFNAPGNGNADSAPEGPPAYLQKWQPSVVTNGSSRLITAYYRATNFDSSYSSGKFLGYSVVVDTPKAITTKAGALTTDSPFLASQYTIRVNVDNTGGFTNASTPVTLQSTTVTLNLPAGMYDPATNSRTITKTIPLINLTEIGYVDFQFAVDPNLSGAQQYSVTVAPQSGGFQAKTVTGSINVAATPRLFIRTGANLVSPPWQFNDSSWESVLGLSLNADFQAYTWDALRQQYVAQPAAQRGIGTWIVSQNELGYKVLSGGPKQPDDQFPDPSNYDVVPGAGSPSILLHTGWNLVGNPYNYAFPIGNLIGVPVSGNAALSFADLLAQNYTNGIFTYYDPTNRSYSNLSNSTAQVLPPNSGYWIYAQSDFYLQFPPLFELFLRSAPATVEKQRPNNWKLQLAAASSSASDSQNFVGIVPDAVSSRLASLRKPPMPQTAKGSDALSAFVTGDGGASMMRSIRASSGTQTFTFNVLSKNGGAVTVSWPNLKAIPSNLQVKVTDPKTRKTIDARKVSGYTVSAKASTVYPLTVTVTPTQVAPEQITSTGYGMTTAGGRRQMRVTFGVTTKGSATITVYKNGSLVSTIASDIDIAQGSNAVLWPMTDTKGQPLPNGTYTVAIKAVGEDNTTATRQLNVIVRQ